MNLIVSVDNNWGIGYENDLLYKIPTDLAYFKDKTINKVVVMGDKTLFSLPNSKPLKNRTNVVISLNKELIVEGAIVLHSLNEVLEYIKQFKPEDVFIIGGAFVYKEFLPYCTYAYITKINSQKKANKFFTNLDELPNWQLIDTGDPIQHEGIEFKYCLYKNNQVEIF